MNKGRNRSIRLTLLALLLFVLIPAQLASPFPQARDDDSGLLETGHSTKLQKPAPAPSSIKIVTYNIRWRGGEDLRKLIELFKTDAEIGGAAIVGLQEVDRNKKRTANQNTVRLMAEELGMYYAWAAPPSPPPKENKPQEEETGVAILSAYPLAEVRRILLPNEGPQGRRRVALGATVQVGQTNVRVYSVHAETRISNERRIEQLQAVLDDLNTNHAKVERVVVLGDFNTLTGKDVSSTDKLFTSAEFSTPFAKGLPTWKTFIIELKLDWLWLRGLRATNYGIDHKVGLSDHWPLWVEAKL
jgi:endonuclease/exonuclease/phosphatase family metal-dependent hydrolase